MRYRRKKKPKKQILVWKKVGADKHSVLNKDGFWKRREENFRKSNDKFAEKNIRGNKQRCKKSDTTKK